MRSSFYRRERERLSAIDAWALGRYRWYSLCRVPAPSSRALNDTPIMFICEPFETVTYIGIPEGLDLS